MDMIKRQALRSAVENSLEWVANEEENLHALNARHRREREQQLAYLATARDALTANLLAAEREDIARKQSTGA